jgi:hypothetical protein
MKFKNINLFSFLLFLLVTFVACKKNELRIIEFDLPTDKSYVRFGLLSPGTPSVMIKVNDVKINGAATSGSIGFFPSFANLPDYAAITPNANFRLSLPNIATTNDSVLFFNGTLATDAGKFYSVTLADTGVDRTVFAIEDKINTQPDSGFMNIRFINAMAKTPPLSLIRIDSTSSTIVTRDTIARNIAFKSGSDFINVKISPTNSFLRYRLIITGTGIPLGPNLSITSFSVLSKRSTTLYAYGFGNGINTFSPGILGLIYNK